MVKQYIALIGTDNVKVTFTIEAIERIAEIAEQVNHETENIGARRLHTILENYWKTSSLKDHRWKWAK